MPVPKGKGGIRLCVNYRALNFVTKIDAYVMPSIDSILESFGNAKIFSTLDAQSGYHQIPINPKDMAKTAFGCHRGSFEFTKLPFGLVNGPAVFQKTMDRIFENEKGKYIQIYIDIIIVFSKILEEHINHLNEVFQKLKQNNVKLIKEKCELFKKELNILGHHISAEGIRSNKNKLDAINQIEFPTSKKRLQSFLGLVSYCRKYILVLSETMAPLFQILKVLNQDTKSKIIVTEELKNCFEKIKTKIKESTVLAIPDNDATFIVTTDASNFAIGATLSQIKNDKTERIVEFYSKTLNKAQINYSTTDKEALAVILSIKK